MKGCRNAGGLNSPTYENVSICNDYHVSETLGLGGNSLVRVKVTRQEKIHQVGTSEVVERVGSNS